MTRFVCLITMRWFLIKSAVCKDKVVLESGTGSGILSILAARAGAKRVFAIEKDPVISIAAHSNITKSPFKQISFINKDIFELDTADLEGLVPDVIIAENLSTWLVAEPAVQIMNHLNTIFNCKKDITLLPSAVNNNLELAQSQYLFEDSVKVRTYYFGFTGVVSPIVLSGRSLFKRFDFSTIENARIRNTIEIEVTQPGIFNSLKLTSPIELANRYTFDQSDSLMPPVIVPCDRDLEVRTGDKVVIDIDYNTYTDWSQFHFEVSKK